MEDTQRVRSRLTTIPHAGDVILKKLTCFLVCAKYSDRVALRKLIDRVAVIVIFTVTQLPSAFFSLKNSRCIQTSSLSLTSQSSPGHRYRTSLNTKSKPQRTLCEHMYNERFLNFCCLPANFWIAYVPLFVVVFQLSFLFSRVQD